MTETLPTVAKLLAEEEQLVFPSFTNDDAWNLGLELVEAAKAQDAPIAIDIVRGSQQMFHAAMSGSSADNDLWIQAQDPRRTTDRPQLTRGQTDLARARNPLRPTIHVRR